LKTAGDIIAANNQEVWSIPATATVFEALKLMSKKNIGALPVGATGKTLSGSFLKGTMRGKSSSWARRRVRPPIEVIMTRASQMVTIQLGTSLEACMALMTVHHIRHLPVFADKRMIGIISSRAVIQVIIEEKNGFIDNLRDISDTLFTRGFDDHIAGGEG